METTEIETDYIISENLIRSTKSAQDDKFYIITTVWQLMEAFIRILGALIVIMVIFKGTVVFSLQSALNSINVYVDMAIVFVIFMPLIFIIFMCLILDGVNATLKIIYTICNTIADIFF